MSDDAKAQAQEMFDFVVRCYPDALIGLKLEDHPTLFRTYFYGVMKTVFAMDDMDQYVKMHLLNMLRHRIGLSADELAAEMLKYISDQD